MRRQVLDVLLEHLPAITTVQLVDRVPPGPDPGDSGALTGRELLGRAGWCGFWPVAGQAGRAPDPASQKRLARTLLLLAGQGRREHSDATELRDDPALRLATGDRAGTAPLGKAGRLPSQPTLSRRVAAWSEKEGVEVLREGLQRLAGWRLKARVAASEDAGHRRRQPAGRGSRGTAGQRVERLLSPARVSSDRGGGGGDGRHPGRGAGAYGGRRAGVRAGGAGAGGAASVREGRRALDAISRRAADGGAGGAGHALCGPGAQQRRAEAPGAAGGRRGLGCAEQRGARRRAPHLGLRVLPGRVVVPFPQGRARRTAGRTHPALLLAADLPSGEMSGEDLLALYRRRGKAEGGRADEPSRRPCRRRRAARATTGARRSGSARRGSTPSPATRCACCSPASATGSCTSSAPCWSA